MQDCVLKDWVMMLPYRMQSVLMTAIRGCDTARKDDNSKWITRGLRSLILNNADPTNSFIVDGPPDEKYVTAFLWDMDSYPLHFIMHTIHAAEIVGVKHPDKKMREWWIDFYRKAVKGMHLNPETCEQLDVRLGSTPAEKKKRQSMILADAEKAARKEVAAAKPRVQEGPSDWDGGTGTSHGDRNREWSGGS